MENPIKGMIWGYPYFWKHPYGFNMIHTIPCLVFLGNIPYSYFEAASPFVRLIEPLRNIS